MACGDDQEIQQLEAFAKELYETTDALQRKEVEKILINFQNSPDSMSKCCSLLERGSSSYAQMLASTTLIKIVSRPVQTISTVERVQIRNYVLNYLATRGKLEPYVILSLSQLYSRLTKAGWFDVNEKEEFIFRNVIADVGSFVQSCSVEQCTIGMQLLSNLTSEMNQCYESYTNVNQVKQRKIFGVFKSEVLFDIFRLVSTSLKVTVDKCKNQSINFEDVAQRALMRQMLELAYNCLSLRLPATNWRTEGFDFNLFQPFFDLYFALPTVPTSTSLSSKCLMCLYEICPIGKELLSSRSFFDYDIEISNATANKIADNPDAKPDEKKFFTPFLLGIRTILETVHGLSDSTNYHEFCQLIASLKMNYTIGNLCVLDGYPELIQLIAKFTVDSLTQMLLIAPNSVHFLLQFWNGMACSVQYVKLREGKQHYLDKCIPEVVKGYVKSRIDSIGIYLRDGLDNPLEDDNLVEQEMDQLADMARCEFQTTYELLLPLFDSTAAGYEGCLQQPALPPEFNLIQNKLCWLVQMIGSVLGGRTSYYYTDGHDLIDGDLCCRIMRLMQLTDTRLTTSQGQNGCEHLELGYLTFIDEFRKTCMGDHARKSINVYKRMSEVLGITDEAMIFTHFIRKIMTNLKFWTKSENILTKTLYQLNELSIGNNSNMRKYVKTVEIQFMLNNHVGEHFPFLGLIKNSTGLKLRSHFYRALSRFVIIDSLDDKQIFTNFMSPFSSVLEMIGGTLPTYIDNTSIFKSSEDTKWSFIGVAYDLFGICSSLHTRPPYVLFFEWVYPKYIAVFQRAIQVWFHDTEVSTPLLKFFIELVQNRADRLQFGDFSPNSVLLFREISQMICSYGSRILTTSSANPPDVTKEQHAIKLKGIRLCFKMLKSALCAHFVNFGIMSFYGDQSLSYVLDCFIKMVVSITVVDFAENPKLSIAYFGILRYIALNHMNFLTTIEPNVFIYILTTLADGVAGLEATICGDSSQAIDYIMSYLFEQSVLLKGKAQQDIAADANKIRIFQLIEQNPQILQELLAGFLKTVLFEDSKCQWAMTRPILPLILLNEEYYGQLRDQIIRSQPVEKQSIMASHFEALMSSVERNVFMKNKDKFTLNMMTLRRNICGI